MFENTITIMKYRLGNKYLYRVMDKFDNPDEADRLDMMIIESKSLQRKHGSDYEQLWIKNTPII